MLSVVASLVEQIHQNKIFCKLKIAEKSIRFVGQFFKEDGKIKPWNDLKADSNFVEKNRFGYIQIIQAIPRSWKISINDPAENINNLVIQSHHLTLSGRVTCWTDHNTDLRKQ